MVFKGIKYLLLSATAVAFITGCAHSGYRESYSSGSGWGNYKCTVMGGNKSYLGWATSKSNARHNALDKCKNSGKHSCKLINCINDG